MIGLTMLGGYALVAVVAAIGSVTGAAILEGLVRLSRCCMSARTVIAAVAREEQPQPATPPQTPPGHPEQVRDICPGYELAYDGIVRQLLSDDELAEAIKEAGRVQ